jgi:hypothetical protein
MLKLMSDLKLKIRCLDSKVGIAMDYWMDDRDSIPGKGKVFLFSIASRPGLGSAQPPIHMVPGAISPAVKRPEREADHSSPFNAEVKNGGAIAPLPHISSWRGA